MPTPREGRPTWQNPAHALDYRRCSSDTLAASQREQIEILRAANPRWWVTHNGCHQVTDYRGAFTRDLDFLSYDAYPFFEYDPSRRAASQAFYLDNTRAHSGNFLLMEQQCGAGGQGDYFHDNPEPGELRRPAWASLARGGDGLPLFRERSCRFGAEEYWVGVLDHDNVPRRRYHEAAALGAELARVGRELLGSSVRIDVGVAGGDFDSGQGHAPLSHGLPSPHGMAEAVHGVFYRAGHAVGIVHPEDTLTGLKLYIVPHLALFDPAWVPALDRFVADGGTLLLGARTGCKDRQNNVVAETLPGVLRGLVGATVEEYGRQNRPDRRPLALRIAGDDTDTPTTLWYEQLAPDAAAGTEVAAAWTTRHLAGTPAITRRAHGSGQVIYVGTYLTRELTEALLPLLGRPAALPEPISLTPGVEVVERVHPDGRVLRVVINHHETTVRVAAPADARRELLTESALAAGDFLTLAPSGVALLAGLPG